MKSIIAERIERNLAKGDGSEVWRRSQQKRLDIVNAAFLRGGESEAYYADMMFVVGHTD